MWFFLCLPSLQCLSSLLCIANISSMLQYISLVWQHPEVLSLTAPNACSGPFTFLLLILILIQMLLVSFSSLLRGHCYSLSKVSSNSSESGIIEPPQLRLTGAATTQRAEITQITLRCHMKECWGGDLCQLSSFAFTYTYILFLNRLND